MKQCASNLALEVKGLTVEVGGHEVLRGVNLEVKNGNICAIVGANGAGKTLLLKTILGLNSYVKGEVKVMAQRLGYVPQRFEFDRSFPLSIEEFLKISGGGEEMIAHVLMEVDMTKERKKMLGALSGGQIQRVLIARALLNDPQVLFLDEPTTGIDAKGQKSFYEVIQHLNEVHDVTVVMISHEAEVVSKYANQIFHVGDY